MLAEMTWKLLNEVNIKVRCKSNIKTGFIFKKNKVWREKNIFLIYSTFRKKEDDFPSLTEYNESFTDLPQPDNSKVTRKKEPL